MTGPSKPNFGHRTRLIYPHATKISMAAAPTAGKANKKPEAWPGGARGSKRVEVDERVDLQQNWIFILGIIFVNLHVRKS